MPKQTHYPAGPIVVEDQHLLDISAGMHWDMRDANDVRFLAVRGTIWVGDCQTTYNLTLVEYQLHIDEVPWLIFSTLADVLEKEFVPGFWEAVNHNRKSGGVSLNYPGMEKPTVSLHRIPTFVYPFSMTSPTPCVL